MDENMKLIMAEFAKLNNRLTGIEDQITNLGERMTSLEERTTSLEERTANIEEELIQVNSRLGMLELKADKSQDNYEKLEAYLLTIASDVKNGFYKSKHQFRLLEDQGNSIIKVLAYRELIPLN
jgi:chromosome segregation ATPase